MRDFFSALQEGKSFVLLPTRILVRIVLFEDVAKLGFEPRQTEPESVVLPLHHLAKQRSQDSGTKSKDLLPSSSRMNIVLFLGSWLLVLSKITSRGALEYELSYQ